MRDAGLKKQVQRDRSHSLVVRLGHHGAESGFAARRATGERCETPDSQPQDFR